MNTSAIRNPQSDIPGERGPAAPAGAPAPASELPPSPDILPCPFCGGTDLFKDRNKKLGIYWVECIGCGTQNCLTGSKAEAIAAWNRRAPVVQASTLASSPFPSDNQILYWAARNEIGGSLSKLRTIAEDLFTIDRPIRDIRCQTCFRSDLSPSRPLPLPPSSDLGTFTLDVSDLLQWLRDNRHSGLAAIMDERERQIHVKGFTPEHDDQNISESMVDVAGLILWQMECDDGDWAQNIANRAIQKYKHDRVHQLAIAGALIAAEIDRLTRLQPAAVEVGRATPPVASDPIADKDGSVQLS